MRSPKPRQYFAALTRTLKQCKNPVPQHTRPRAFGVKPYLEASFHRHLVDPMNSSEELGGYIGDWMLRVDFNKCQSRERSGKAV